LLASAAPCDKGMLSITFKTIQNRQIWWDESCLFLFTCSFIPELLSRFITPECQASGVAQAAVSINSLFLDSCSCIAPVAGD
jgi:hypothetical protein